YCVADGGGCGAILDMSMCQTTPGCSWDAMYGECFEVIDDCAAYQDMPSCSGDMSCGWNNYAGNCFSLEGDCTDIHLNDMDCVADERCEWNAMSTTCVFKMSEVCFTYTDMNSCNTQQGCLWDDVEQICVQDIAPPECFNIFNPMDCDNTFGCMWDGMYAQCVQDFGDVCSLHENSIDCNNDANCYYDGVNGCEMLDNGGNCGFFGSDQVLCELHSTYCQWNTYGDGYCEAFDPGPGCYNYPGEFDCDAAPGCYWSAGETACLEIIPGECWNYTSQTQCGKDYLCTWDVDQCVVAGGPDCSMIYNDIDCANTMGCMWDGMYCVQDMGPDCSMIYNDVDCGNTMGCYWNGYACVEDMGPDCSMIYNDVDCGNTMGCYWNGYACVEDMGPDCSMIYNDVDCANTMGCMWDGYQCVMDMGGADCWNIYNDIDCNGTMGCYWDGYNCNMDTGNCYDYYSESFCENNENCYWNGYSCTDDLGCESYTISDCYYNGCEWNDYYGQCLESGTGCAAFNGDEYSCGSSFDCYWDAGNQLCVAQCGVGLHWNGYQCEEDTGTCADYFEYNDCNATTGCYWDGYGSNQCQTLVHGSQCEAYGFEYSCNQNPDFCEWYSSGGPYGNCGPIAVDCSAYEEFGGPNACIASSLECEWNFNNGTCVPEGMAGCGVYENNGDCDAQVGSCEWNYNESICVNFGTAGCASYGWDESTACDNEPYCVWDSYYGVCNTQWDLLCGSYTEPTSCNMDFGCVWNPGDPGNCMEMNSEMYCSTFMDDASCEVHSAYCNWYSASNVCAEAYYECGYYSQTDPATCNSDPDCEWFYGEEFCANQGDAGCFKYGPSDQVACDEDAMCAWNGYMCDQDQGAVCSQYYDINTCNWEGCFWYGDHCGANPCMDQNDPYACNESPYCYWSYEYCEAGEDSGEPCSALSISYCDAYGGGGICNWHEGDMSYCEPAGGIPDCSLIYSDVDCANTMGCMWDGDQCVMDMGGPDCSAIFNDVDCGNTLGCMWDGTYCVEDMGGSACGENLTLEACNTDSSCVWDDVNTECVQFDGVASCNKFADQMYCENHSVDCKWYAGLMTCDGNTYGCGYYEFATVEQCNMDVDCDYNHNTDMCMEAGTAGCGEFGDSNTNCNAQTGNCEWNYSDNHCVPFDTAGCSKYGPLDESMCSGDPNCDWDTDHCIESVPAGCSLFDTDATCNAEATCIWIGSTCEDMASGSQCTLLSMQGDCESHTSFCNWYSGLNLCGDIADGCGFYGFGAMACNADTDCEYNFNMPGCVEFGTAGCGKHENDSMCIGDPMCTWNGTNCIPSGPPACNTYMDQFTCQNNSCTWVSGQCGGMGQTWCSSSYIAQGINCYTYMDQSPCEAQNGCVWNLTECVDASANDCNMDLSCMWNGPMSTCIEDMSNQCMMTYGGDQFGCNMATTCNWQPGQCGP
ncbi:MAG TPA: hypothetical protein PLS19_00840, partial [bacterium]|nr:hypothetical protein [bacterium]